MTDYCIGWRRNPHVPTDRALIDVNQPHPPFRLCRDCWHGWIAEDHQETNP